MKNPDNQIPDDVIYYDVITQQSKHIVMYQVKTKVLSLFCFLMNMVIS